MASFSIETRKLKNGEARFKTTVVVKKNQKIIHRESKTFRKKELARAFGRKRVNDIESEGLTVSKIIVPLQSPCTFNNRLKKRIAAFLFFRF